ncbi:amidohydrolase family protein [Dactylosporangium sp. NPDC005572]|uniref:amidohydrolase family protein n=1 Tax=Dactylosporangium sp. NPDC005572 TaxID=3156889 RepID=UPI0033BDF240
MTGLVVHNAELYGRAGTDVRIAGGVIAEIGRGLTARRGEELLDARGGALLPGLCDHHVHLHAMAMAARSVHCGPPTITGLAALAEALARAPIDEYGWVRGVGYTEDVAGPLDAAALDRLHAARPVRIQHRGGSLWVVNTAAAQALGLVHADHPGVERDAMGRPTGRLWRADSWLRTRLPPSRPPGLGGVGGRLARLGITHVTDATPDLDATAIGAIGDDMRTGALPQRVQLLGAPLSWADPGEPDAPTAGPHKIVIADSRLPALDDLTERVHAAHNADRAVAVHCVTREALVLLVAVLERTGTHAGDRIEHAALIPVELIGRLRELGTAVVTQPGFLADRGDDYLRDVPADDHTDLYRVRSLLDGGVACAFSSDAPYGPADPWAVIDAAAHRRTRAGRVAGPAERLTADRALDAYLGAPENPGGPPRPIAPHAPADLVLLRAPRARALARPSADLVAATVIAGAVVWAQ